MIIARIFITMYMGTVKYVLNRVVTNMYEHKSAWAQTHLGTNVGIFEF